MPRRRLPPLVASFVPSSFSSSSFPYPLQAGNWPSPRESTAQHSRSSTSIRHTLPPPRSSLTASFGNDQEAETKCKRLETKSRVQEWINELPDEFETWDIQRGCWDALRRYQTEGEIPKKVEDKAQDMEIMQDWYRRAKERPGLNGELMNMMSEEERQNREFGSE
jgi:hypothetical protein